MPVSVYKKQTDLFGNVLAMENDIIELWVTLDYGPRICRFAFKNGKNFMCEDPEKKLNSTGSDFDKYFGKGRYWYSRGGHRIWVTPEIKPITYYPDNEPIDYTVNGNTAVFYPPEQDKNMIKETMTVCLEENDSVATITSTAKNCAPVPKDFGLWNITVMCKNGIGLMPQNVNDTGLLYNRTISLWPYANMADKRVTWGKTLVSLKQDPKISQPFKFGMSANRGWAAYLANNGLFVKRFPYFDNANYTDGGCNTEMYTNADILEVESLAPMHHVDPMNELTSVEVWSLTDNIPAPKANDMDALETIVSNYIEE